MNSLAPFAVLAARPGIPPGRAAAPSLRPPLEFAAGPGEDSGASMSTGPSEEMTRLLRGLFDGDASVRGRLAELVYAELRSIAERELRGLRGRTLQPTALVHEAWLKLALGEQQFESRRHFFGVAAKAMRTVLVDHVRAGRAQKRGGERERCVLDDSIAFLEGGEVELLDLDLALSQLEREDADLARWVEMRFFSGMTHAEIAAVEGCSESTIERGWRFARAKLRSLLKEGLEP